MFSMRKPKKPIIIMILIVLLVFTGYINHNFTQRSNSRVSSDYQRYEEMEMAKHYEEDDINLVEALSKGEADDDIEIMDTIEDSLDTIDEGINKTITENISQEVSQQSKNYFVEQRLSRDKLRASLIDRISDIINNESTNEEVRAEAQKKIMNIGDLSEKELRMEGLIKSKGFPEVITFLTDDSLKVIVAVEDLTEQDVVKILDIAMGETDLDAASIKIMKKQ